VLILNRWGLLTPPVGIPSARIERGTYLFKTLLRKRRPRGLLGDTVRLVGRDVRYHSVSYRDVLGSDAREQFVSAVHSSTDYLQSRPMSTFGPDFQGRLSIQGAGDARSHCRNGDSFAFTIQLRLRLH